MRAMVLDRTCDLSKTDSPLRLAEVPMPVPAPLEVRIRVCACGVCHTELDEIEGRTPPPTFPMIPGHQVVGEIDAVGDKVTTRRIGERVGVGWIYSACGDCEFCRSGDENLCPEFVATGRDRNGGYAEYLCVPASFAIPLPEVLDDLSAAPLLCAGAIGYRSLALTGLADGQRLGLTGFGASAHLVLKLVRHLYPKTDVYVFARSAQEQSFALELGATWAGATEQTPPARLHAIIDTTPAWLPVLSALRALLPRGRLVINAIRKEPGDIDSWRALDYPEHLWMEKEIKSVANVTRKDIATFLEHAATIGIEPTVQTYSLEEANKALVEMKRGAIRGARVLRISQGPTRPHAP